MFKAIQSGLARRKVVKALDIIASMTVADIMTESFIAIRPDDTVVHAATKMIAEDISCLIVLKEGKLDGIITERDFLQKVPLNKKVFNQKVKNIMTPRVITVKQTLKLDEAAALMKKHNFRRIVVETEEGYGLLTQTDFSMLLLKHLSQFPINEKFAIGSIMTKNVLTASAKESFSIARKKMQKRNVGSILIMDKGIPEGIFTEYDVLMQFFDQEGKLTIKELSSYMRKYVRATSPEMSIFDANKMLLDKHMRRLPITNGEKIIGILTQTDVVRFVFTNLKALREINKNAKKFGKVKQEYNGEFVGDHMKVY